MNQNTNCSACNVKLKKGNYKKDGTIIENCYNEKKRKKIKTISIKINNQETITLTLTITIEHFWLVLVFQVKHISC